MHGNRSDVAEWLEARLSPLDSSRVRAAREDAFAELRHQLEEELGAELREIAGLPPAEIARALFDAWTAAAA
ncbi:MAG: hypothetical protein ABIP39_13145 [Polyangiaceae bacterium]